MKRPIIKNLLLPVLLCAATAQAKAGTLLTHLPVNQLLAEQLVQGTEHQVRYLPPKRYTLSRLANWFDSKVSDEQARAWSGEADALVHLPSLWPEDPLYPLIRQYNIRVVGIDSADPQTPKGSKVAVRTDADGRLSPYVWLNPNNLKSMTTIVSRDLSALYPSDAEAISANQQKLLKAIVAMEQANQDWLFDNEVEQVIVVGEKLADFVYGYNLFALATIPETLDRWQETQWQMLAPYREEGVVTLLLDKTPPAGAQAKLEQLGFQVLVVDTVERLGKGVSLGRWQLG